ncbi:MAG: hypothetical protein M9920_09185 [Verrucomicrobiae bacterium]|nr:hypothetical protein [Verrucomicrobiae bacterium]
MIVGAGVGLVIGILRFAVREVFPSSSWTPFLNGMIVGSVVIATLVYFGSGGRDRQLLRKDKRDI